jgi:thioredoxin 1
MAQAFTDSNFQTDVLSSDKLTVVDFWAEWCGPCRAIGPVIDELSKDYAGRVNVGKVNVDENPQVSMNYGITSIPAILFIKNGEVVDKLVGAQPKAKFCERRSKRISDQSFERILEVLATAGTFFYAPLATRGWSRLRATVFF